MPRLSMQVVTETLRLAKPFRISGHVFESSDVIVVTLNDGDFTGRGEGGGVFFLGDDVPHMLSGLESARGRIEEGVSRDELREIMPPGVGVDDFVGRRAEGNGVVAQGGEVADHQPGQAGQLPAAVQVQQHPVDVVEVFVHVF